MRKLSLSVGLLLACWLVFQGVGQGRFLLLDDDIHVSRNPFLSSSSLAALWTKPYQGLYVPMTYTVWSAEKRLFDRYWSNWHPAETPGESAAAFFHWVNLALHGAAVVLVFGCLLELVGKPWAAAAGAALFALHPVQVEPIAWVSGLKDVLSGFFSFAALLLYLRYSRLRRTGLFAAATVCYTLALLSKPSAAALPLVAWIFDVGIRETSWRWSAKRLVPWLLAAVPILWISKLSQPDLNLTFVPPLATRPFIALDALAFYLSKLTLPVALAPDYGRNPLLVQTNLWKTFAWIAPPLFALLLWRRSRTTKAGFLAMAAALIPVLGLVPFYFQEHSTVADRYLYLAMIGPAVALAAFAARRPRPATAIGLGALLLSLALLSHAQVSRWQDSVTLFTHTLKVNPRSLLAHNNLGTLLEDREHGIEALYHYKEVLRISPGNLAGHYNSGRVLARLGRYDLAEKEFAAVLEKAPDHPDVLLAHGAVQMRMGQRREAEVSLQRALSSRPTHPETLTQIGLLRRLDGNCKDALKYFDAALLRRPASLEAKEGKRICLNEAKPRG